MKNDGISQSEPRNVKIDEAKVCQLVAVLQEMWPDLKPAKPDLKVVPSDAWGPVLNGTSETQIGAVTNEQFKNVLRATWPERYGRRGNVIQFPRAKKRGAKKRHGACADIVKFRCGRVDFSDNERAVFDTFASTQGARYAVAVVEYFRLPLDEGTRYCRQGMTPAEFLRNLDSKRV